MNSRELSSENSRKSYPDKFLKGVSVFPDQGRIFHRVGYQYDVVSQLLKANFDGQCVTIELAYHSGKRGMLYLMPLGDRIFRLQMRQSMKALTSSGSMLIGLGEPSKGMSFIEQPEMYICLLDGYRIVLEKAPFNMKIFTDQEEMIFELETEQMVEMYTAPPLGFRTRSNSGDNRIENWAFLSWHIRNQDHYFGLGEKFTRFEKTSTRTTIWEADTCGSNTTDLSYKAVPVLFSTAGWAVLLHSSYRSHWEIGSFSYATGSLLVEEDQLDVIFILRPSLKELVQTYTALTGKPTLPPKWALGIWMSRASYRNRMELLEIANRLRAERIPCDVLHIDPAWLSRGYYNEIGVEVCNFEWNYKDWGEPKELFQTFDRLGFNICLWSNPYFSEDSAIYQEAKQKGYLVRTVDGDVARLEFGLAAGIVDFTNPEAKQWWQSKLIDLMRQGASVFKVDFGDRVPENALFYNGRTGKEMHNLYVHLYAQAQFEASEQVYGRGFIWRRPGYIGSQQFIGSWAGDTQVSWEGMRGALRGGLSAAFTGEALWGHDIGGFVGPQPSRELFIRWMQFGLLSPLARFHGTTPREPWNYGELAINVARHYGEMRYRLIPYFLALCHESTQTGLPILRPMVLEYPEEPLIEQVDDQYLLGKDLLVAPIFQMGARQRWVYFPKGKWYALEEPGLVFCGRGFHQVGAPLERIPVFVRGGAILPRYAFAPQHLKNSPPGEWILDIYPAEGSSRMLIPEEGFTVEISHQFHAGEGKLSISQTPLSFHINWIGLKLENLRVNQQPSMWQNTDEASTSLIEAHRGVQIEYRGSAITNGAVD